MRVDDDRLRERGPGLHGRPAPGAGSRRVPGDRRPAHGARRAAGRRRAAGAPPRLRRARPAAAPRPRRRRRPRRLAAGPPPPFSPPRRAAGLGGDRRGDASMPRIPAASRTLQALSGHLVRRPVRCPAARRRPRVVSADARWRRRRAPRHLGAASPPRAVSGRAKTGEVARPDLPAGPRLGTGRRARRPRGPTSHARQERCQRPAWRRRRRPGRITGRPRRVWTVSTGRPCSRAWPEAPASGRRRADRLRGARDDRGCWASHTDPLDRRTRHCRAPGGAAASATTATATSRPVDPQLCARPLTPRDVATTAGIGACRRR